MRLFNIQINVRKCIACIMKGVVNNAHKSYSFTGSSKRHFCELTPEPQKVLNQGSEMRGEGSIKGLGGGCYGLWGRRWHIKAMSVTALHRWTWVSRTMRGCGKGNEGWRGTPCCRPSLSPWITSTFIYIHTHNFTPFYLKKYKGMDTHTSTHIHSHCPANKCLKLRSIAIYI